MVNYFVLEESTEEGEILSTYIPDTKENEEGIMKIEEYIEALCEFDSELEGVFTFCRAELCEKTLNYLANTYPILVVKEFKEDFHKQDWKHLNSLEDDLYIEDTLITQELLEKYLVS